MNKTIYALGFFDGVHAGHQALLKECCRLAAETGCDTGAITFRDHPDALVFGAPPVLINTPADRERLLHRFVSRVVTLPFDRKMLDTPWQDFLDMLCRDYHAAGFVCGDDFHFGYHGQGNGQLLLNYCRTAGLPGAVVPEQTVDGTRVSSTHIRTLLEQGSMEEANRFLGHPQMLTGTVVHGRHLGSTLGIPTANLPYPDGLVVPRKGVYAAQVCLGDTRYPAVTNVGTRPTVDDGNQLTIEGFILDFQGDLYGQKIQMEFYKYLREERKFPSFAALTAEVMHNAEQTREYFAAHP